MSFQIHDIHQVGFWFLACCPYCRELIYCDNLRDTRSIEWHLRAYSRCREHYERHQANLPTVADVQAIYKQEAKP